MKHFIPLILLNELKENEGKAIRVNDLVIALFKLPSGEVFAIENSCPHIGAPLDNGLIEDKNITCLWHGWCFDLQTGHSINCPGVSVKTYPIKIQDQKVWIQVN
jgi:nitrite reductase (NADH) small subunit